LFPKQALLIFFDLVSAGNKEAGKYWPGKEYVDPLVFSVYAPKNGTNLIIITLLPENLCQRNIGSKRYRKPL